ncbi:MAG: thiamine pyrophosphate-dependent dehydrogenase E1 component subunit alpha [Endozoicomonadaceae bacterium]|nr:thiamine pyrophosphate-dependent dehydrogenase E1 component subunit alpha [Endozoicomonadaceae bacterium]
MINPNNTSGNTIHNIQFISPDTLKIKTFSLLDKNGSVYKDTTAPDISKTKAIRIYKTMQFIRLLDERMLAAQRQGRISFYMQCTGEEAAVTASTSGLNDNDMIFSQYREQAAMHYRGFSIDEFMNQMFSNERDYGKGRQMPVHYGKAELNCMTLSSPLATQIPQAAGYAYGQKMAGLQQCTLCYLGEGAASEGDFHAGLNMAAVHQVPVIFFCRNNGYAISTIASEQFAGNGITARGAGYGIEAIRVDGDDVLAVYAATKKARDIAVKKNKPILIEALTYRLAAHSSSDDPSGYRTKKEEALFLKKDPIQRFRQWLLKKQWLNEKEDSEEQQQIKTDILAALKKAEQVSKPPVDEIITDVYHTPTPALQQQLKHLKEHIKRHPEAYPHTAKRLI